jgi:hypothetical protein
MPQCKYIALSYVWGLPTKGSDAALAEIDGSFLRFVPRVVEDAIIITTELLFQYLWVDRYCINQNDAGVRHDQLRTMDSVYRYAQATIVAAAGPSSAAARPDSTPLGFDSAYGLPGVSIRSRSVAPMVKVGSYTLVPFSPSLRDVQ